MRKVERNDLCPCGSGKKYKKCHLRLDEGAWIPRPTDEEGEAATRSKIGLRIPPERPSEPLLRAGDSESEEEFLGKMDEEEEGCSDEEPDAAAIAEFNRRWEEFEAADWEKRLLLTEEMLVNPEFDGEEAFEYFNFLYEEAGDDVERVARVDGLAEELHTQRPELYERNRGYHLWWQLESRIQADNLTEARSLIQELAAYAFQDIDIFNHFYPTALYHNFQDELIAGMSAALEGVRSSRNIVPWGIDEFEERLFDLVVRRSAQKVPPLRATDPTLQGTLQAISEYDEEILAESLQRLSQPSPPWSGDVLDPQRTDRESLLAHLNFFFHDFEFYARQRGIPGLRACLARLHLQTYTAQQSQDSRNLAYLCPVSESLDRHLARLSDVLFIDQYAPLAVLVLMPVYLDFLIEQGMLEAGEREPLLVSLQPLSQEVRKMAQGTLTAPSAVAHLDAVWGGVPAPSSRERKHSAWPAEAGAKTPQRNGEEPQRATPSPTPNRRGKGRKRRKGR